MNPLAKRPDIMWSSAFEREVIMNCSQLRVFQNNGEKEKLLGQAMAGAFNNINQFSLGITNSANDPFNPQPEKDIPYPMVTVTQNLPRAAWDSSANARMIGTINSGRFTVDGVSIGKDQALLLDRTSRTMYQGKLSYREVTTTLLLKTTHDLILQDRGYKRLFKLVEDEEGEEQAKPSTKFGGGGGDVVEAVAKIDGEDTPIEVLLDGKGNPLKPGDKPVYIHFTIHNKTNFNALRLPREKQ